MDDHEMLLYYTLKKIISIFDTTVYDQTTKLLLIEFLKDTCLNN